jgi:ABC-type antimicrobial peptide transport system permease subunit
VRDFTSAAKTLSAAVTLLLLVACANVASVMLARALARRREMGIRLALGAGRGRIIRQLFVENVILGVAGAAIGLALGQWAVNVLIASVPVSKETLRDLTPGRAGSDVKGGRRAAGTRQSFCDNCPDTQPPVC